MDRTLRKLFDYQRFAENPALNKMIQETQSRYMSSNSYELSDDELFSVAAAGDLDSMNPGTEDDPFSKAGDFLNTEE